MGVGRDIHEEWVGVYYVDIRYTVSSMGVVWSDKCDGRVWEGFVVGGLEEVVWEVWHGCCSRGGVVVLLSS